MSDVSAYALTSLARNWWALVIRGLIAIVFGLIAWFWPGLALFSLILLFAAYAISGGLLSIVAAIRSIRTEERWIPLALDGVIGVGAGAVALAWPDLAAKTFLYVIAIWAILSGVLEIVAAVRLRKEIDNEWLLGLTGLAGIIFGVIAIARPLSGALAVLWLIGIASIVIGALLIALGWRLRGLHESQLSSAGVVAGSNRGAGANGGGAGITAAISTSPAPNTQDSSSEIVSPISIAADPGASTTSSTAEPARLTRRERALNDLIASLPPEGQGWLKGDGTTNAPAGYPLKGNINSRIYHAPGGQSYHETIAEVHFATDQDAVTAGFRPRQEPEGYGIAAAAVTTGVEVAAAPAGEQSQATGPDADAGASLVDLDAGQDADSGTSAFALVTEVSTGEPDVYLSTSGDDLAVEEDVSPPGAGAELITAATNEVVEADAATAESGAVLADGDISALSEQAGGADAAVDTTVRTLEETTLASAETVEEPIDVELIDAAGESAATDRASADDLATETIEEPVDVELISVVVDGVTEGQSSTDNLTAATIDEPVEVELIGAEVANAEADRASADNLTTGIITGIIVEESVDVDLADEATLGVTEDRSSSDDLTGEGGEASDVDLVNTTALAGPGGDADSSESAGSESVGNEVADVDTDVGRETTESGAAYGLATGTANGDAGESVTGGVASSSDPALDLTVPSSASGPQRAEQSAADESAEQSDSPESLSRSDGAEQSGASAYAGSTDAGDGQVVAEDSLAETVDASAERDDAVGDGSSEPAPAVESDVVPDVAENEPVVAASGAMMDVSPTEYRERERRSKEERQVEDLIAQLPPEGTGWVRGDGSYRTPKGYPIKGNASSGLYHMPGGRNYAATIPEICFATAEDARASGFRPRSGDPTEIDWSHVEESPTGDVMGIRANGSDDANDNGSALTAEEERIAELIASLPPEGQGWVRGNETYGVLPGYEIKGNESSRIYHVPGGVNYDDTIAEFLFATTEDAQRAGFRPRQGDPEDGPWNKPATVQERFAAVASFLPPEGQGWVRGDGTYDVLPGYEIKGNESSRIYHVPGGQNYDATIPEFLFSTTDDAEKAGFRPRRGDPEDGPWNKPATKDERFAAVISTLPPEGQGWVLGDGTYNVPAGYEIKGNESSRIYHVPGGQNYDATIAEFCFSTTEVAQQARFRKRKGDPDDGPWNNPATEEERLAVLYARLPAEGEGWIKGDGGYACPTGYEIKGNEPSRIYHIPGGGSYDATIPEFCFAEESIAAVAGFRRAKNT